MNISITKKEIEAIRFAMDQISLDFDACEDIALMRDINEKISCLGSVIQKYEKSESSYELKKTMRDLHKWYCKERGSK